MEKGFRWMLALGAITAAACGGKVVVDGSAAGDGGAGGAGSSSSSSGSTASGTGIVCGPQSCSVGSDGSCDCSTSCDGQALEVQCAPIQGGASCTCIENDIKIAVCVQEGVASCSIFAECCAPQFFPQGL